MTKANGKHTDPELDLDHELPAGEADDSAASPSQTAGTDTLQATIEKLQSEKAMLVERMARMQAEFDNARKRAQREQQEFKDYALTNAIKALLPVLDSFDHALASSDTGENFRSGMELIDRQFHDALNKLGVTEVASEGQPFDPTQHEAIEMVETDKVPDNHVLQELQRGYKLKDRLLRPAMVPAIVYGITLTFNLFNLIYFVSRGGPLRQTEILVTTAFRLVNEQSLYGVAAAFSVYIALILLVITLFTNRVTRATESYDV
jgi:molecular chaperone GrpE